jgi:CRP/FNR family cyclic AMP-dependent transcriptional regulator
MSSLTSRRPAERLKLLQTLSPEQLRRLEPGSETLALARGQRLYGPGDPSDRIYLVRVGVIKITAATAGGRDVILGLISTGDIFGELALVDDMPRDHMAVAHEDSVVHAIGRDRMVECMRDTPDVGFQINRILGVRLRTLSRRVSELLCKSAELRVSRTLLALADAHGIADAQGVLIPLRLSQRDLANLAGLSRETVNAALQDLRARGIVEADRRHIRLLDPDALHLIQ